MLLFVKRFLAPRFNKLRFSVVPGYEASLLDILKFRRQIVGRDAPLFLYGQWRKALGDTVPQSAYEEAGLPPLADVYPGKHDRQIMVVQALLNVLRSGVDGAVAEFGCFRGHTALQVVRAMENAGKRRDVYLFDSFSGLPPSDSPEDADWHAGDLSASFEEVVERFQPFQNVKVVKGFFSDSLKAFDFPVSLAHVDADLYTSTCDVNEWLLDRVVPGGIVIYDDYGFLNCLGAKKAVDEAMSGRDDYVGFYLPTGQYMAIRRGS